MKIIYKRFTSRRCYKIMKYFYLLFYRFLYMYNITTFVTTRIPYGHAREREKKNYVIRYIYIFLNLIVIFNAKTYIDCSNTSGFCSVRWFYYFIEHCGKKQTGVYISIINLFYSSGILTRACIKKFFYIARIYKAF